MPVDDAALDTMLQDASTKLDTLNQERNKLRTFIQTAKQIKKIPTRDDPTVFKDVMDRNLGVKMTAGRRDAIFAKLVADKTTLGL